MKKKMMSILLSLSLAAGLTAISPVNENNAEAAVSGEILLSGSTSIQPLAAVLAKEFKKTNPKVSIKFANVTGSGAGIADATKGIVDIGMSSRGLTAEEKKILAENIICNDGLAVTVNKSNPLNGISPQQLFDLYSGKITNWKTLIRSYDKPVALYSRESGSGTKSCLEDVLKNDYKLDISKSYTDFAGTMSSTGQMQTSVKNNTNSIGYMSLGDLDENQVKALSFDGVKPSIANVANGSYKMSRPFVFATKGVPNTQTKAFIDWCKGNERAQSIIAKMGFVRLSLVKVAPRQVKFTTPKKITLKKGKKRQLKYIVTPANAVNKQVTFMSSNKKAVSVTAKGVVKAKKAGKRATITVTTISGGKKATCKVVVKKAKKNSKASKVKKAGNARNTKN